MNRKMIDEIAKLYYGELTNWGLYRGYESYNNLPRRHKAVCVEFAYKIAGIVEK